MEDFTCNECQFFDDQVCHCTFGDRCLIVAPDAPACGDFELHPLFEPV